MKIRPATANDLPEIRKILEAAHLGGEDIDAHVMDRYVADMDGKIVGTIGLEVYQGTGLLRSAAVLPSYQRHGTGGKLVAALIKYARKQGITSLVLLTTTAE